MLKNINIKTKLVILIVIMLIGICAVGIIGYYYNTQSSNGLSLIYNEDLVPIQLLNDVRAQSRANEANLLKLILLTDASQQKQILDDIDIRVKAVDDDLLKYESSSLDAYETENYALLKKNLVAWNYVLSRATGLIKSNNQSEAYSLFLSTGSKALEDLQTNTKDLANYNATQAQTKDNQNDQNSKKASILLITVIALAIIISIALGLMIALSIINPILKVTKLLNKTSEFDLVYDTSFDYLMKNKDETGIMASALGNMRKSLRQMAEKIIKISNTLASHSEELTSTSEENAKTIGQVVTTINELAEGNTSQAEMVSKTSITISDVVKTIGAVNKATTESADNAVKSLEIVNDGQKAVILVTERMKESVLVSHEVGNSVTELGEMIAKVGSIVDVITSIAQQTNLLALNAAIEAARAGEAGRGFAVVSEEIRKLAEGSSSAAKEIIQIVKNTTEKSNQMASSMSKTRNIVIAQEEAVNITKGAFDKIKLSVEVIVKQAQESAVMLQSIDVTSKEIEEQTQDMAAVAEQSAASTEEISASSEEQLASIEMIAQAASELSGMAEELNNEINRFKIV